VNLKPSLIYNLLSLENINLTVYVFLLSLLVMDMMTAGLIRTTVCIDVLPNGSKNKNSRNPRPIVVSGKGKLTSCRTGMYIA